MVHFWGGMFFSSLLSLSLVGGVCGIDGFPSFGGVAWIQVQHIQHLLSCCMSFICHFQG